MRRFIRTCSLRFAAACFVASALASAAPASAQDFAPTYSRTRMGAQDWRLRGDGQGFRGHGFNNSFYNPFFVGPVVTGSYYQRPYPYHFDYYKHRWGAPPADYGPVDYAPEPAPPTSDCPCADPPPVEVVQ